jgi:hypothetical protein
VFTTFKKLKSKFSNTSGVYDHYFDRIVKSKSKESGYHGFYFKQLNIGETYIIGEKYDFSSFQKPISKFNKLIEVEHSPIVDTIDVKIPENKLLSENLLNVVDFNTIKVEDIFPSATVEIPNNTPTYQESTKENIIKRIQYGIRYILTGKK